MYYLTHEYPLDEVHELVYSRSEFVNKINKWYIPSFRGRDIDGKKLYELKTKGTKFDVVTAAGVNVICTLIDRKSM